MKVLGIVASCFLLIFAFGISSLAAFQTISVDKSFKNREIKVKVGSRIRVELQEPGATGYLWTPNNLDDKYFEILKSATEDVPPRGDVTGSPVARVWLIQARQTGKSELKFSLSRPWENDKSPADTFVMRVRIIP